MRNKIFVMIAVLIVMTDVSARPHTTAGDHADHFLDFPANLAIHEIRNFMPLPNHIVGVDAEGNKCAVIFRPIHPSQPSNYVLMLKFDYDQSAETFLVNNQFIKKNTVFSNGDMDRTITYAQNDGARVVLTEKNGSGHAPIKTISIIPASQTAVPSGCRIH